jgi:hypothetical protein
MSENVTDEENKKTIGFKVSAHEYNVLKQYAKIFYGQMIEDPNTKEYRRILEQFRFVCLYEMQLTPGTVLVHYADTVSRTKTGTK